MGLLMQRTADTGWTTACKKKKTNSTIPMLRAASGAVVSLTPAAASHSDVLAAQPCGTVTSVPFAAPSLAALCSILELLAERFHAPPPLGAIRSVLASSARRAVYAPREGTEVHCFHEECITEWLRTRPSRRALAVTIPVCKFG